MTDGIYTLTDVLIKSKQEGVTKSDAKYWKFIFLDGNEEIRMNCFEHEIGKDVGAGDRVDVDYLSRGDFKNAKAFRPSSQQPFTEEGIYEEEVPIAEEEVVLTDLMDLPPEECLPALEKPKSQKDNLMTTPTNRNNKKINPDFIVNIQGKDFITINGLLALAEEEGGIEKMEVTNLDVNLDKQSAYATVKVTMKDGRVFENGGSGMPANLKANMQKNYVEMAISRAMARSLRFGINADYCSAEEMDV